MVLALKNIDYNQWGREFLFSRNFGGYLPTVAKVPKEEAGGFSDHAFIFGGLIIQFLGAERQPETANQKRISFEDPESIYMINPNFINEGIHQIPLNSSLTFTIPEIFGATMVYLNYTVLTNSGFTRERGLLFYGGAVGSRDFPLPFDKMLFFKLDDGVPDLIPFEISVSERLFTGVSPSNRIGHAAAFFTDNVVDAFMLVFGGFELDFGRFRNDIWKFHLTSNTWENVGLPAGKNCKKNSIQATH